MDMEDNNGLLMDHLMTQHMKMGRPVCPTMPQPPHDLHYAMVMLGGSGGGRIPFGSDLGMGSATSGLSGDSGGGGEGNGLDMEIGGRWPKEETLALLEIRSRLDSKFKEANHKGPLWEEVSRIMCVEHGYKRTGKKCSEKFENLYKYYKKIKEGKAGRRDKKHYRFFRQFEAIYGETNTSTNSDNKISVTNATLPQSMEDNDCVDKTIKKRLLGKKSWKTMITDFIESKMNIVMERQDKWMEKVMHTMEQKENERILKEEKWRKEQAARLEKEKKFRSNEQAWIESRDLALIEALHKLIENKPTMDTDASCIEYNSDQNQGVASWGENEITQLIQLRRSMETRFQQSGFTEDVLWEEIALAMACLGYNRNALICKAKWDHLNFLLRNKKKKENIRCSNLYSDQHNFIFHQAGQRGAVALNNQQNDDGYRVLMSDPEIKGNYYGKI